MTSAADTTDRFLAEMTQLLGHERVDLSVASRSLVAQDVFDSTAMVSAVFHPRSSAEISAIVSAAARSGMHILPRGGGASYTGGYLSSTPGRAAVVDFGLMNGVEEISPEDMYVVVGAGCTWASLDEHLAPRGMRAAYWGPLSGRRATVGGAVSQNAIFWGSGETGTAADAVIGLEVVIGSGDIIRTGTLGVTGARPFFRNFGPDLTGLFLADAGALGIKTKVVLRLVHRAPATDALSFLTNDIRDLTALMSGVARHRIAAQQMGLDETLKSNRMASENWREKFRHAWHLLRSAPNLGRGIGNVFKIARAGTAVLDGGAFSAHFFVEGADRAEIAHKMERIRVIARDIGGREVEASVPKLMLSQPFGPLNGVLGPRGERWVPVHCIVPHSKAIDAYEAIVGVFDAHATLMAEHSVTTGFLFTTAGTTGFVIEPMLFWPDTHHALHHSLIDPDRLGRHSPHPDNPGARDAVRMIRAAITNAVDVLGAVHIQLGRYYPHSARLDPPAAAMLAQLRGGLDPHGVINPGALT